MKTTYCLSLTLLLAAPLVATTTTQEEGDSYDSYSDEGDAEEVQGMALPSAPRTGQTVVKDILDDNYHMFRRKRAAERSDMADDEENNAPVFHNFGKKIAFLHQRIKEDLRIRYFLKTV